VKTVLVSRSRPTIEYSYSYRIETRRLLGFDSVPDQSTPWRSWNSRFSADLRETVERTARTGLINAQKAGSRFPVTWNGSSSTTTTDPERPIQPDDQAVLKQAAKITTTSAASAS